MQGAIIICGFVLFVVAAVYVVNSIYSHFEKKDPKKEEYKKEKENDIV